MTQPLRDMTVLLLVKGRDLHTLRWMWHANRIGFPYPIIVADGGDNPISRRLLADGTLFPNLEFQYVRYNDASYLDYYKKVVDAAERAATPYVFRADNDDFILPSGIEQALTFLRAHPDYVWSGAHLGSFSIGQRSDAPAAALVGRLYRMVLEIRRVGYEQDSPLERVLDFLQHYNLQPYYAVFRRDHFLRIYQGKVDLNLQNLELCDLYKTLMSLVGGKHHLDPTSMMYLHQTDTSEIHKVQPDLAFKIFRNNYMGEYDKVLDYVGGQLSDVDHAALDDAVRGESERSLRHWLRHGKDMTQRRVPRWLRNSVLAQKLRLAKDMRTFRSVLASAGCEASHLAALQGDMVEVKKSLAGDEFLHFLKMQAGIR